MATVNSRLKIDEFVKTSINDYVDPDYGKVLLLLNGSGGSVTKDSSSYNRTLTMVESSGSGPTVLGPQLDSSRMLFGTPMYKLDGDLVGQVGLSYSGNDVVLGAHEYCFEFFIDFTSVTGDLSFSTFQNIDITYKHSTKYLKCNQYLSANYTVESGSNSILPGNLYHIALCRTHNVPSYPTDGRLLLFINGTLVGYSSRFSKTSSWSTSGPKQILACHYPNKATFHIGQLRFTNGTSRYSGTTLNTKYFDVPTEAFLSSDVASDSYNATPLGTSWVDVKATKGSVSIPLRVPVNLSSNSNSITYNMLISPYTHVINCTADGVILSPSTAFNNLISYVRVFKNGIEDTNNWTFTRTDTSGVTSTITSNAVHITGLTVDTSTVLVSATKAGEPTQMGAITVEKNLGDTVSGLVYPFNHEYAGFVTYTQGSIYIRIRNTGELQIKYGASGTYKTEAQWYTPLDTSGTNGASYWLNMQYSSTTGDTLQTGTNGTIGPTDLSTWYQMNVDREWHLTPPAAPAGKHLVKLTCYMASSNSGEPPNSSNTTTLEVNN